MRIAPNSPLTSWFNRITDRDAQNRDENAHSHSNGKDQDSSQSRQDPSAEEETIDFKAELEKIERALEWFAKDEQARANGLTADKNGAGPGLKVVLKDLDGRVIRQLSPREFLKLQAVQTKPEVETVKMNGKILDRKY